MARHSFPIDGTVTDLAARLNVGRVHVSEVLNGIARCSAELAVRIETATNGAITRSDLRPDLWPPEHAGQAPAAVEDSGKPGDQGWNAA